MQTLALLRIVHRWLGLALAAIVLAVGASGGLLLLREPYYRAVYPTLRAPITPIHPRTLTVTPAGGLPARDTARWRGYGRSQTP